MNSLSQLKRTPTFLIALLLVYPGLSPRAQAVNPPPDGGYPGQNTAEGTDALFSLTSGWYNTATGFHALYSNTTGGSNTAIGSIALASNTTGAQNTAIGSGALLNNTTGYNNTAIGEAALEGNTTGTYNTATGAFTLPNTVGSANTANGYSALHFNYSGRRNAAYGYQALFNNTTGGFNIALGQQAGKYLTTGSNNIDIGSVGVRAESNTIRIGTQGTQTQTFIAGIFDTAVSGSGVMINAAGQLGTAPSSQRFKQQIQSMSKQSDVLLALRPVTFRYKKEIEPGGIPQFGLVAEDVEKVNPDLVARDADGKPYTVRYEAVNVMLLNEFLKEHRRVEELQAHDAQQQNEIKALKAELKEQASQIQKVSAQLELTKPAPETALDNH
jgi:hypothetical protein